MRTGVCERIFLELVQNDGNNKSFKMLPELDDDPGLTLTIFMTGSHLFLMASVLVTAYRILSALVFPSLF